jgi:hypothetical protein
LNVSTFPFVRGVCGANVVRHACLLDPCPRCRLSRAEDGA